MGNQTSGAVKVVTPKPLPLFNPANRLTVSTEPRTPVLLASLLPSGFLVVHTKSVTLYRPQSNEVQTNFDHPALITSACIGHDPEHDPLLFLATGCIVEIVSTTSLTPVSHFDHGQFPVCSVAFYPEGCVFVGLSSGKILQWSMRTQVPMVQFYSEGCPQFLTLSARHKLLAADHFLGGHTNVVLYQSSTGIATQELTRIEGRCLGLEFLDRRNMVLSLSTSSTLFSWDVLSGNPLFQVHFPSALGPLTCRSMLILSLLDQDFLLLNVTTGVLVTSLTYDYTDMQFSVNIQGMLDTHKKNVAYCAFSMQNNALITQFETQETEIISNFSEIVTLNEDSARNLPLFSLHQVPIPTKNTREKRKDLPMFDLGLPKSTAKTSEKVINSPNLPENKGNVVEKTAENQAKPGKTGPSEDSLQKIRARLEGRPSRNAQEEGKQAALAQKSTPETVKSEEITEKPETKVEEKARKKEKEGEPPAPSPVVQESAPAPRVETSFERFLRVKKSELMRENPGMSVKEVVFKVSELWGELTEEEQMEFEASV